MGIKLMDHKNMKAIYYNFGAEDNIMPNNKTSFWYPNSYVENTAHSSNPAYHLKGFTKKSHKEQKFMFLSKKNQQAA